MDGLSRQMVKVEVLERSRDKGSGVWMGSPCRAWLPWPTTRGTPHTMYSAWCIHRPRHRPLLLMPCNMYTRDLQASFWKFVSVYDGINAVSRSQVACFDIATSKRSALVPHTMTRRL